MQSNTSTLETRPNVKTQWLLEGNTCYQTRRYEEAAISYARAIQCDPTCQSAFHNLGSSLLRLRRFEEALRAFKAQLAHPHDATTHCDLGDVLSELRCNEEALRAYATSLQLDPCSARTYNNLGVLLGQIQNWEGASRAFAHAVQLDPDDAVSNYNLSRILTKLGRTEEAKQAYLRARALGLKYRTQLDFIHITQQRRAFRQRWEELWCTRQIDALAKACCQARSERAVCSGRRVLRALALYARSEDSDHCRCVSTPKCVRTSWKVSSTCHRKTNHSMIWVGLIA